MGEVRRKEAPHQSTEGEGGPGWWPRAFLPLAVALHFVGVTALSIATYRLYREDAVRDADRDLLLAAKLVPELLAHDFHDRAVDATSVPFAEQVSNAVALTEFCRAQGIRWAYTAIRENDRVFFTAANPLTNETSYFQPYLSLAPGFTAAFDAPAPVFLEYTDEWGAVRSAVIPQRSPGGRRYVACADFDLDDLQARFRRDVVAFGAGALVLFILPIPLLLAIRARSIRHARELETRTRQVTEDLARRLEAEQRLEESRRFNARMLLSIPDFLYVFDLTAGRFVFRNVSLGEFLGYESGEVEAFGDRLIVELMHPDDYAGFPDLVRRWEHASDHDLLTAEFRLRARDGSWRWFADRAAVFRRDAAGRVTQIVGNTHDTTARRSAEEALRARALQTRQILDGLNDAVFIQDIATTKVVEVNARACELYGYPREELMQLNVDELSEGAPAFDWTTVRPLWDRACAGAPQVFEWRARARDGRVFWALVNIRKASIDGRDCMIVAVRDIDERQRAEERVRETERRLAALIDLAPFGAHLYELRPGGELVLVGANRSAERILGLRHADLIGQTIEQAFPALAGTPIPDAYRRVAAEGTPFEQDPVDYQDQAVTGAYEVSAIRTAPGQMVVFFRDVTERQRAAAQRRAFEHQLQENQRLESLGVLAGGIAHDFNNILMAILGNASLAALDLPEDSPARPCLTQIEKGARRAADLCGQMLAYSGRGRFLLQPVDLSGLVREVTGAIELALPRGARVRYELADAMPAVEADPTQLRRVLMNLTVNAAESLGEAGGEVVLRTGAAAADAAFLTHVFPAEHGLRGPCVFLEVQDNGCGIAEESCARIFDPFYSTKFTGRGLGLAAALGTIRGHKGAITFASAAGRGSTFRLVFRAAAAGAGAPAVAVAAAPQAARTLLLIDDEESVQLIGRRMLERSGYRVLTAADGRAGVETFRQQAREIAGVVLDLTMPGMSGEECFRELQAIRREVPVLITSGYPAREVSQRFPGGRPAGFLQKPYAFDELLARLAEMLGPPPA